MLKGNNILVQKSQRSLCSLSNFQIFTLNNFFITKNSEFISFPLSKRHNWGQKTTYIVVKLLLNGSFSNYQVLINFKLTK